MEQLSDIRPPVIVPPAADDRVYHLDHVPQHHRRSSLRQVADLILEPGHRLFARHGVKVVRLVVGAAEIGTSWPELPGTRQRAVLTRLIERIDVGADQDL